MVERCEGQNQIVDLGGSDAHGETLVGVLCCGLRATGLLAEHARRDIPVYVDGCFAVAGGELQPVRG